MERKFLLEIKNSQILGDERQIIFNMKHSLNACTSSLNYIFEFSQMLKIIVDGKSDQEVNKVQELVLEIPQEFKDERRVSIEWTGRNFQETLGYFKGY